MITRALILAAGRGVPIADQAGPNCLVPVGGRPLLERTLRVLAGVGVRSVGITVGHAGDQIQAFLSERRVAEQLGITVELFENSAWTKPNGLSVLAASGFVTERCLLVMADQIAAPGLLAKLASESAQGQQTTLAVDRDLARVFDIADATKVKIAGAKVAAISKDLTAADAVSAGLFVMAPSLLDALRGLREPSLTEGVQAAAERGLVDAYDVGTQLWQDVDSPQMRLHAEWLLRVYGDELAVPAVNTTEPPAAGETLALVERLLAAKDTPGYVLFNPGPVMTSARVKAALVHYDVCHRDQDYSDVLNRLQMKLRPVFGASPDHEVILLTGSGTAAMEMAVASVVPPGKKVLVISNGAFGERLGEVAKVHGIPVVPHALPWGQPVRPQDVARQLDADPDIAAVTMIHHETSVGLLNPVGDIGAVCRKRDRLLVVDAVSSLGAEDLDVVRDQIDVCYSSANKCLHSVSGVSFVCVAPHVWPRIEAIPPRVYYLDLGRYRRVQRDQSQTPFTPAVSSFFALAEALDELAEQGGVPARRASYRERNLRIRRVLGDLGFESLTKTGRESHTISTLRVPDVITVPALYDGLKARGFVIYRCKGELASHYVQIANMGALTDATVDALLTAVSALVAAARAEKDAAGDGAGAASTKSRRATGTRPA